MILLGRPITSRYVLERKLMPKLVICHGLVLFKASQTATGFEFCYDIFESVYPKIKVISQLITTQRSRSCITECAFYRPVPCGTIYYSCIRKTFLIYFYLKYSYTTFCICNVLKILFCLHQSGKKYMALMISEWRGRG